MASQGVCILGATGSIGQSTLNVLCRHPERFHLDAVTANTQVHKMVDICRQHRPRVAVMSDPDSAQQLKDILADQPYLQVLSGKEALQKVASSDEVDIVMA